MGVVLITVVTVVDRHKALPNSSIDVDGHLWEFLSRQCFVLASEPLGIPIVVRSADLYRFSSSLLTLPKACRPIVRTRGATAIALDRNGVVYHEDRMGVSIEWLSVLSGYNHLNSSLIINQPYHLWVLGAADLCKPVFDLIPGPKRMVYAEIADEFHKSWQPPFVCGKLFETIPWTTVEHNHPLKLRAAGGEDTVVGECGFSKHSSNSLVRPPTVKRVIYAVVDPARLREIPAPGRPLPRRRPSEGGGMRAPRRRSRAPAPARSTAAAATPPRPGDPRAPAARRAGDVTWMERLLWGVFGRTSTR
ncbi:truncated virion membrane protein [Equid alphaherpesvirus 1]|uniref:Truncated virion membrane protein n=1 Tax=Equid alphaherpesvirus 1 TaxID=10326 RepID=A0A0A7DAA5_9ALPH|nr:truncated virion membrane protein [Equid alphaherpesvirus 1]AII81721.1 truncated virion membrane protein [Equid alphaherpesvirus 1]